jgi:hypothetical protein
LLEDSFRASPGGTCGSGHSSHQLAGGYFGKRNKISCKGDSRIPNYQILLFDTIYLLVGHFRLLKYANANYMNHRKANNKPMLPVCFQKIIVDHLNITAGHFDRRMSKSTLQIQKVHSNLADSATSFSDKFSLL